MKYFNLDMHISIAHDVKTLLPHLGHQVDSVCMSGHTWVNGERQGTTEIVSPGNYANIDQEMCDRFYSRYRFDLDEYDGFIHSYPPAFAMLFEKWNKPIYTIACTRYEFPCGSGNNGSVERLRWLNDGLIQGYKSGQIKLIANNLYDKHYAENFCGGEWTFIPSICCYLEDLTCHGDMKSILIWDRNRDGLRREIRHPRVHQRFSISEVYDRRSLVQHSGIVHIPYNVSIMSAFEHYAMGIPMFVPSPSLLMKWVAEGRDVLNEVSFPHNLNRGMQLEWIKLADWYDTNNMPFVCQFNSFPELYDLLDSQDRPVVTKLMKDFYLEKKQRVLATWREVLK